MLGLFINKYMDASHLRYNATILRYFVNKYMDASLMIALMIACDSHMIAWTNICLDWIEMVKNLTSQKEFILEDILIILQIYHRFQRFQSIRYSILSYYHFLRRLGNKVLVIALVDNQNA